MRTMRFLIAACAFALVANINAFAAANHLKVVFKGTSMETNSAGKVITRAVTQQTWLIDFARDKGLTSLKNLAVSYHLNADEKGDQIEVINAKTGEVLGSVFGLFFSEAFGRTGLTNSAGTATKTLQYLYTSQDSHSLGAAVVTKTTTSATPKVTGQMQYELLPNAKRKSVSICSGTFMTGAPFAFQLK